MEVPKFKEAVAISNDGVVYVFPLDNPSNTVFIWDTEESNNDWANWFVITDKGALKMSLHVGSAPYATVGSIDEHWDEVLFGSSVQITPAMFFILIYAASNPSNFSEPKILSIKNFDKEKVRALAKALKAHWLDLASADIYDDDFDYEDYDASKAYEEEEECFWCIDKERGICYSCED